MQIYQSSFPGLFENNKLYLFACYQLNVTFECSMNIETKNIFSYGRLSGKQLDTDSKYTNY